MRQDQKQASIRISSLKKTNIKIAVTDMDVQKTNHNRNLHSANLVDSYVNLLMREVKQTIIMLNSAKKDSDAVTMSRILIPNININRSLSKFLKASYRLFIFFFVLCNGYFNCNLNVPKYRIKSLKQNKEHLKMRFIIRSK